MPGLLASAVCSTQLHRKIVALPPSAAVEISVTKDAVKFGTTGDIGSANILCRQNNTVDKVG
jgi:hypothetical protein